MPRRYWVDLPPTALSAYTMDILELLAADDKPISIISTNLHQVTDFGDAADEVLSVIWERGNTTSGSGGTTITPTPVDATGQAAGFVAEAFNSTAASAGTEVKLARHGWNVRAPLERPYLPEERFGTGGTLLLVCRLESSPVDSITIAGSICVEEAG